MSGLCDQSGLPQYPHLNYAGLAAMVDKGTKQSDWEGYLYPNLWSIFLHLECYFLLLIMPHQNQEWWGLEENSWIEVLGKYLALKVLEMREWGFWLIL